MSLYEQIQSGKFKVLVEIAGADDDVLADFPVEPIHCLYGKHFKRGPGGEPIDFDHLKQSIGEVQVPNDLAVIDLEDKRVEGLTSWVSDPTIREQHHALATSVIETIRDVQPSWRLGWFGRLPNVETRHANGFHGCQTAADRPQGKRHREYLNAVALLDYSAVRCGESLDFYQPSLYLDEWHLAYAEDPTTAMAWYFRQGEGNDSPVSPILFAQRTPQDVWEWVTFAWLKLIRVAFPDRPLIPVVSSQWWAPHYAKLQGHQPHFGEFFSAEWFRRQLEIVRLCADSVAIWVWPKADGWSVQGWLDSDRWKAICDWAEVQRGPD